MNCSTQLRLRSVPDQLPSKRTKVDTGLRAPTGLLDRWNWDERAAYALARAGNRAALLLVHLDTMGSIVDLHGPAAGTVVQRRAARVLRRALRATDIVGHGGDEFLVLLPARDRQLGELIARRIRSRIRRAIIPVAMTTIRSLPSSI